MLDPDDCPVRSIYCPHCNTAQPADHVHVKYTFAAIVPGRPPLIHEESWDTVDEANTQAKAWVLLCGKDNPDVQALALVELHQDKKVRPYQGEAPGADWIALGGD